jgi:hypothetical protein
MIRLGHPRNDIKGGVLKAGCAGSCGARRGRAGEAVPDRAQSPVGTKMRTTDAGIGQGLIEDVADTTA